jgi:hypothetical protein
MLLRAARDMKSGEKAPYWASGAEGWDLSVEFIIFQLRKRD